MYDIQNNKVRTAVAKYLLRQGCHRVQKSVYMGNLKPATFAEVRTKLTEVQAMYDNDDSLLLLRVDADILEQLVVIGRELDVALLAGQKSVHFI